MIGLRILILQSSSAARRIALLRFGGVPMSSIIDSTLRAKKSGIVSIAALSRVTVCIDTEMIIKNIKTVTLKIANKRRKSE